MQFSFVVLCILFLQGEVLAVRTSRETASTQSVSEACPQGVIINTKGDCVDNFLFTAVDSSCCDHIRSCHEKLDRLLTDYNERISIYMTECGLRTDDVDMVSNGSAVVRDDTRICATTCQQTAKLMKEIDVVNIAVWQKECSDPESLEKLRHMGPMLTLVGALDKTWRECNGDDGDAQPLCPDSSMVTHECGHFGIQQDECEQRGCCWDKPSRDRWGRAWCYKARGTVQCETKCPDWYHAREKREDCSAFLILDRFRDPNPEVRRVACEEVGCCWQPLEHNSADAWCFYKPCI